MKHTINFSEFCDAFRDLNREENFTYEGKKALFDILTFIEEDTGEEMELDVVALCCDYSEYDNLDDLNKDLGSSYSSIEELEQETTVIPVGKEGLIIANF